MKFAFRFNTEYENRKKFRFKTKIGCPFQPTDFSTDIEIQFQFQIRFQTQTQIQTKIQTQIQTKIQV